MFYYANSHVKPCEQKDNGAASPSTQSLEGTNKKEF